MYLSLDKQVVFLFIEVTALAGDRIPVSQPRHMKRFITFFLFQGSVPFEDIQIGVRLSESQKPENDGSKSKRAKRQALFVTGMPPLSMAGHTGYLTAATMPPIWARINRPSEEEAQSSASQE
jgi:hypothetical protein